jgi:hypothetical protein
MTVWSHTQGAYPLRGDLATVLALPVEKVDVIHMAGSGCYGHNGADDVALNAALLARGLAGQRVMLQWDARRRVRLDPGRLKRGVGPNRELGPPLKVGEAYTLAVGTEMTDSCGRPLRETVYKRFSVTEAVREPVPSNGGKCSFRRLTAFSRRCSCSHDRWIGRCCCTRSPSCPRMGSPWTARLSSISAKDDGP